jgi:hypothetical protein
MASARKFFRVIWRINSLLILMAAGTVIFAIGTLLLEELGVRTRARRAEDGVAVSGSNTKSELVLGRASIVPGTQVMRAELQRPQSGVKFSGGYGSETRNLLFIEPGQRVAHWLLPDNEHIVADSSDISDQKDSCEKRVIVTAVLVKPASQSPEGGVGRLLLFDPPGKKIVEVADHVRTIQVANIGQRELNVLYERERRLFLSVFDPQSISKIREQEIEVPQLK